MGGRFQGGALLFLSRSFRSLGTGELDVRRGRDIGPCRASEKFQESTSTAAIFALSGFRSLGTQELGGRRGGLDSGL